MTYGKVPRVSFGRCSSDTKSTQRLPASGHLLSMMCCAGFDLSGSMAQCAARSSN